MTETLEQMLARVPEDEGMVDDFMREWVRNPCYGNWKRLMRKYYGETPSEALRAALLKIGEG